MKNALLIIILLHLSNLLFSQVMRISIEDSIGNRDTVIFGFDDSSTLGIDSVYDETNIFGEQYSNPEIRVIQRDIDNHNCLRESHSASSSPNLYYTENIESKINFRPIGGGNDYRIYNSFEFLINSDKYPVSVVTEYSTFNNGSFEGGVLFLLTEDCDTYFNSAFDFVNPHSFIIEDSTFTTLVAYFEYTIPTEELENNRNNLRVYPNPTTDILIIKGLEKFSGTLDLYDGNGRIIKSENIQISKNENFILDLKNMQSGIYFIRLKNNEENIISTKKFVVR